MSKKQLIMEKALELFAKQGFEATSVQQITDYCSISKGAFYLSFKSKDELIISLIDHFMEDITFEIDQLVKTTDKEELLYAFYYAIFQSFQKRSEFGKLLIKEQAHPLNEELLEKMHYYTKLVDKTILLMIERLYGEKVNYIKYDLMYCIKSFMGMYSDLFLCNKMPLDLDFNVLSQSLVEKTDIIAEHTTIPFLSKELVQFAQQSINGEVTTEQTLKLFEEKIEEIDDPIVKESLILLRKHIIEPTLSPAIVEGLIENIRKHPQCKLLVPVTRRNL